MWNLKNWIRVLCLFVIGCYLGMLYFYIKNLSANTQENSFAYGISFNDPETEEPVTSENSLGFEDASGNNMQDLCPIYYEEEPVIRVLITNENGGYYHETAQTDKSYPGEIRYQETDRGYLLINYVPLETYLCYVLPSEMPTSYSMEALKAQAVCARTYAISHLQQSSLGEYGADVDDTSAFQVYNTFGTDERAMEAVEETKGEVLCYAGDPISAYYYACSSGCSTLEDIWGGNENNRLPYITYKDYGDLEEESIWYQWQVVAEQMDISDIRQDLRILLDDGTDNSEIYLDGELLDQEQARNAIEGMSSLTDMAIDVRKTGDVVHVLRLEEGDLKILVYGEYNIRRVLGNTSYDTVLKDESVREMEMVPSGFFTIETEKSGNDIVSFTLYGGGFGHGVGMSQMGAEYLAEDGFLYDDILTYYYESVTIDNVYVR